MQKQAKKKSMLLEVRVVTTERMGELVTRRECKGAPQGASVLYILTGVLVIWVHIQFVKHSSKCALNISVLFYMYISIKSKKRKRWC